MVAMSGFFAVACRSQAVPPHDKTAAVPAESLAVGSASAGATHALESGVTVRELELDRGGVRMGVWIYDPPASVVGRRPVILIAAAGTPLFWGMELGSDVRRQRAPRAQHGYVVVAYALDGHVKDPDDESSVVAGVRAFLRANAGLDNAKAALDHALASDSRADPERVYAVGHSSAATL